MNKQATIEKPLLVTLECAEIIVPSNVNTPPYVQVTVMSFDEDAPLYHFPVTLDGYVSLLRGNSLSGIPKNPDYPRFNIVDASGEPFTGANLSDDQLQNFGLQLKRAA